MAAPNPRVFQNLQLVHYFRKRVTFSDTGVGTGVRFATIPAGAIIIGTDVYINTAFNAGTTNSLTVGGNSANYNDVVNAAGVDETSVGLTQNITPNASTAKGSFSADTDLYVMYQQTGTAATTGSADIMVKYIPPNDG